MQEDVIFQRPQNEKPNSGQPVPPGISAQQPQQPPAMPRDPLEAYEPTQPPPTAPPAAAPVPVRASSPPPKLPPPIPPPPPGEGGLSFPLKIALGLGGFLIVIILAAFILSLFHRGGSGNVVLNYWGLWEPENVMGPVIADFERQHPNIKITYSREDPNHYTQRLVARIPSGTGPDIFRYHSSWVPMLHALLLPMSQDVISKPDFQKYYYPVTQSDLIRGGAIYGIPLEIDTLSLFVNQRILKAAGVSAPQEWTQFMDDARVLTVKDENRKIKTAGAALGTYDNVTHASDIMSLLLWQNGVDPRNISQSSQMTQFASDALNFYTSFAFSDQNVWDPSLDPSKVAFAKENLAMYFGYSWDILDIKALNPTLDFKIYPVPHLPPPAKPVTVASYWVEGVSAKTAHPKEAMEFMHFLAQKETEESLFSIEAKTRLFGEPYARTDLADTLKGNPYLAPLIGQAQNAQPVFFAGDTRDTDGINAQLNGYLGNAVRGGQGGISADSAIKTLSAGVDQVLHQYGDK